MRDAAGTPRHRVVTAVRLACALSIAAVISACATRAPTMPAAPTAPAYPDFVYPENAGTGELGTRIERGWRYLQSDQLKNAQREFGEALEASPGSPSAQTALGYVGMARQQFDTALTDFDRALSGTADYVPALVGKGQALLALERDGEALASFEAALEARPDIAGLQGRIDVLRFRAVQGNLARAKTAADAERWDDARAAYRQAMAASPDSAFLYRELAAVERRAGRPDVALTSVRRALTLDPNDAGAHALLAALLADQGDAAAALAEYERARDLDPAAVPAAVLDRARAAAALARMPAEYRAIGEADVVRRADLAALLGVRLEPLVSAVRPRQIVITDVGGNWAQSWITAVVRAGVMDTLPNYTFAPGAAVRRADLAQTVNRALALIAERKPAAARKWSGARLSIADVPPGHLAYPAVSAAVASGVMQLMPDGTFQLLRPVTGAEALETIGRLEALAEP